MYPQIEFKHILNEFSVNRNDPCEVLRELISNSYDASASHIYYIPIKDRQGFFFFDDGVGLDHTTSINGITPWEAFFSIGKSTKKKGDSIGYKCQGSKLCFACSRIFVATTKDRHAGIWNYKIIDNPRIHLDTSFDISPDSTSDISETISSFLDSPSSDTASAVDYVQQQIKGVASNKLKNTCTLILIDNLETEDYTKYFTIGPEPDESYLYNYIRFYTRHGDVRYLTEDQGFSANHRKQVSEGVKKIKFSIFANKKEMELPFGYPYLDKGAPDPNIKSPAQVARLRDGRFTSRAAKRFLVGPDKFSIILAIDGNRRAHDEYKNLARKGQAKSGIRLSDQRGLFISTKGIKICKYTELLSSMEGYAVLSEGDAPSHYTIIIDGDFDLVTNRNALSKRAFDTLADPAFVSEVKKFLDAQRIADKTFSELLSRLKRESSEILLNEQIDMLESAKSEIKTRERIRITDKSGKERVFLSPKPGEEYLVGVLYSQLASMIEKNNHYEKFWHHVVTFSTQGIDSLGLRIESSKNPFNKDNVCSIEYKYEFNNAGPFNHALAIVDFIVAWSVNVDTEKSVRDTYTCFGKISKAKNNSFEWEITDIENDDGGTYPQKITVIALKELIKSSFNSKFNTPNSQNN
jgi:hypothetical protein